MKRRARALPLFLTRLNPLDGEFPLRRRPAQAAGCGQPLPRVQRIVQPGDPRLRIGVFPGVLSRYIRLIVSLVRIAPAPVGDRRPAVQQAQMK